MLFTPLKLRDVTLKNRIAVSPMCQYSSDDGFATDWHLVHLGSRAVGGAALVFTEATAVTPEGRISPQDLGLWKDAHGEQLSRIARFVSAQGAVPGIQLAHAGRKGSTQAPWIGTRSMTVAEGGFAPIFAPSAIPFRPADVVPVALDQAGIDRIVAAFAASARRALSAGFEVIELHVAHGYLLHQFLSPLSNQRTDFYGGSFENRVRIVRETARAVRKVWPERLPLFLRLSATDWAEGGWTIEDSIALSRLLGEDGVDLIDTSSGGLVPGAKIPAGPGYQTGFAERIRREAGIKTGTVGFIRSAVQAEHAIGSGQADLVLLARELLRQPYWPLAAARELKADATWPKQYDRAKD